MVAAKPGLVFHRPGKRQAIQSTGEAFQKRHERVEAHGIDADRISNHIHVEHGDDLIFLMFFHVSIRAEQAELLRIEPNEL